MNRNKPIITNTPVKLAHALGLSGTEAQEWQVQHALLKLLQKAVRDESLTHAEVAQRGGSSRSRVTAILNGNLDKVSSDLLIRLLSGLGYRVNVSVSWIDSAAWRALASQIQRIDGKPNHKILNMAKKVFVSYKRNVNQDEQLVREIRAHLAAAGYTVFFDLDIAPRLH